jgi:hypothetical protein
MKSSFQSRSSFPNNRATLAPLPADTHPIGAASYSLSSREEVHCEVRMCGLSEVRSARGKAEAL